MMGNDCADTDHDISLDNSTVYSQRGSPVGHAQVNQFVRILPFMIENPDSPKYLVTDLVL